MKSIKLPSWIERLAGINPRPVPPDVFYLGPRTLSYCRFEPAGDGLEMSALRSFELPPGSFQAGLLGGPPSEPRSFREAVAGLLASLPAPVKTASLVLPDAWLRVTFAESEPLPKAAHLRDEVLRFQLKRLVPFRVDELRIQGIEVTPLAAQREPLRLLLGFAVEPLLAAIEDAFAAGGVQLGQVSNASLSLLGALTASPGGALEALILEAQDGYSLVFARGGEPVLHRYKPASETLAPEARATMVNRDLRLTRNFLEQQFPGVELARIRVAAPPAQEGTWLTWLGEGLGPARALTPQDLPPVGGLPELPFSEIAPMLGAASREVR